MNDLIKGIFVLIELAFYIGLIGVAIYGIVMNPFQGAVIILLCIIAIKVLYK